MYGDEAVKLIRELKRYQDTFPPHNADMVQSIQREIRHLYEETTQFLAQRQNDSPLDAATEVTLSDTGFIAIASAAIGRNKRCLLTYHHHRMQHILRLVWSTRAEGAGNKAAPKEVRDNMSPAEQELFQRYAAILHRYKTNYQDVLDLTGSLVPPKSSYIHVRAVKDLRYITEEGTEKSMSRGQMEFVLRTDVERFIEQGYLIQVL